MNKPTQHEVQVARLQRKLNKMRDQRDKARAELEHYKKVISMQPYLETRYKSYTDKMAELQIKKDLEARVKEQAKLIELLQKNTAIPPWNPSIPYQPLPTFTKCGKCGLNLEGVMGYVCSQPHCPSGLGGVWCNNGTTL